MQFEMDGSFELIQSDCLSLKRISRYFSLPLQIPEDEAARRAKRRERNRVAAAKCRQNRQNQIEDLKAQRKLLEDQGSQMRERLENLKRQKQQYEDLIKSHAVSTLHFDALNLM